MAMCCAQTRISLLVNNTLDQILSDPNNKVFEPLRQLAQTSYKERHLLKLRHKG